MSLNTDRPSSARRELSRRARDAFPAMGVYIIRDKKTGQVRVISSRNVHAAMNRTQFELRLNAHANKALQAEWNRDGADRFGFEIVTVLQKKEDPDFDYAEELRILEQLYREEFAQQTGATR